MNLTYKYKAVDEQGKIATGKILASDVKDVEDQLWQQGKTAVRVSISSIDWIYKLQIKHKKTFTSKQTFEFTQHISILLSAGLPLIATLEIIEKESSNKTYKEVVKTILNRIKLGDSCELALAEFPKIFNDKYRHMVATGEASGQLAAIFTQLAQHLKTENRTKTKVRNAMIYPAAIIFTSFAVIALLMFKVIPNFQAIFANFDKNLPNATIIVIELSQWLRTNILEIFLINLISIIGYKIAIRHKKIDKFKDHLILNTPAIGHIINLAILTRITQTSAVLLKAGIPIHQVISKLKDGANNRVYSDAFVVIEQEVISGVSMSKSLKSSNIFPELFTQLVAIGEESGELDNCMQQLSDIYHQDIENSIDSLINLIEPSIMLTLGVIIGGLILVMYLPLFELSTLI